MKSECHWNTTMCAVEYIGHVIVCTLEFCIEGYNNAILVVNTLSETIVFNQYTKFYENIDFKFVFFNQIFKSIVQFKYIDLIYYIDILFSCPTLRLG